MYTYAIAVPKKLETKQHTCQLPSQPCCWISAISQFIYLTLPFSQFCYTQAKHLILAKQQFHLLHSYYYCYSLCIAIELNPLQSAMSSRNERNVHAIACVSWCIEQYKLWLQVTQRSLCCYIRETRIVSRTYYITWDTPCNWVVHYGNRLFAVFRNFSTCITILIHKLNVLFHIPNNGLPIARYDLPDWLDGNYITFR